MVKRKSIREKVKARKPDQSPNQGSSAQKRTPGKAGKQELAVQDRRVKKANKKDTNRQKAFLERVQRSSLASKPVKKVKRKTGQTLVNFSDLEAALQETTNVSAKKRSAERAVTAKQRQKIANAESFRLQQVAGHSKFKADPLSIVAAHLNATLPKLNTAPAELKKPVQSRKPKRK